MCFFGNIDLEKLPASLLSPSSSKGFFGKNNTDLSSKKVPLGKHTSTII